MLFGISGTDWLIVAGAVLTWLIFILGVAQLSRFYTRVMEMRKELDANSLAVVNQLKKIQTTLSEIAIEQRRSTRLMLEQIDLKKAEMTGEFEIIEEPIPAPGAPAEEPPPPEPAVLRQPKAPGSGIVLPE